MEQKTVTYLSTLLFIVALFIAYFLGVSQRTVEVYTCVTSYETKGLLDYADKRYMFRGIECNPGSANLSCTGDIVFDGSKAATEADIMAYANSGNGDFYDGFTFYNKLNFTNNSN